MSRYKIYQINHYDPKIAGKKKRWLTMLYGGMSTIFLIFMQLGLLIFNINFSLLVLILIPLIVGPFILLHAKLKSALKQIKTIGYIEFTTKCIKKQIGDSYTEYGFQTIEKLELYKHIPEVEPGESKSGYFSYILKIIFKNSSMESIVVSDKPADKKQNISIIDTLKTLNKIIQPEIRILV